MEGLAETLRNQQGLSDEAFRDLQEQFNPNAQAGESQGNEGSDGGQGRGQGHQPQGQQGEGQGSQPGQQGQGGGQRQAEQGGPGSLADRQPALRGDDLPEALDRQSEAMEALREGMRSLGEALAENQQQQQGGQGQARGEAGQQESDPLGRRAGQGGQVGTQDSLLQGEDVYRRARELLDEIRRRSGEGERPDVELDYLKRLLDRF